NLVEPRKLRDHLEVAPVLGGKAHRGAGSLPGGPGLFIEFAKAREPVQQAPVHLEGLTQKDFTVLRRQLVSGFESNLVRKLARGSIGVVLDLRNQRRDQIKREVDRGKLAQDGG